AGLKSLRTINLRRNHITNLSASVFQGLPNLSEIYIDAIALVSVFQNDISVLNNIHNLNVYNNPYQSVRQLPSGIFSNMTRVTGLRMEVVDDEFLYEDMFIGLSSLRNLMLSYNQISTLPNGVFNGLSGLQTLDLQRNRISSLSASVFDVLSNLDHLTIDASALAIVYQEQDFMSLLERLTRFDVYNDLPKDFLPIFQDSVRNMSRLKTLTLRGIDDTCLQTDIFARLSALTTLDLAWNSLSSLTEGVFNGLSRLDSLYLESNRLIDISTGVFSPLSSLHSLYLYRNQLTKISAGDLRGLSTLTRLDLSNNLLTCVSSNAFTQLTNLADLRLNANDLN
ncbi:hypothetical protein GUITHDRAFT_49110, partial [Guillardia theta CCMP2712]